MGSLLLYIQQVGIARKLRVSSAILAVTNRKHWEAILSKRLIYALVGELSPVLLTIARTAKVSKPQGCSKMSNISRIS